MYIFFLNNTYSLLLKLLKWVSLLQLFLLQSALLIFLCLTCNVLNYISLKRACCFFRTELEDFNFYHVIFFMTSKEYC